MAHVVVLGTASSVATAEHENTHMAVVGERSLILIDCVSSPAVRLPQAGIQLLDPTDLILTHFHPDHVSGAPLLLMNMWVSGRQKPLQVYGLHHTLSRMETVMEAYGWESWPGFFPVAFHRLPQREGILVLENSEFMVHASPMKHLIPTIGVRVESKVSGKVVVYSCDTEPCPELARLAGDADILLHEATGMGVGHSSPSQAGMTARQANAKELMLIHYSPPADEGRNMILSAKVEYDGPVSLAQDLQRIPLD